MREIKPKAEEPPRINVEPVAEPERRMPVKPSEEFLLRAKRRERRDRFHSGPRGSVAVAPPKVVVEIERSLLARSVKESAGDMDYLRVLNRVEYLVFRQTRRVVIPKQILLGEMKRHQINIVLERKLRVFVLELDIQYSLVLASVDVADLLDMTDDALLAFVSAPFRKIEVDHLRYACAVIPRMIALVPLLRPVHRKGRALEVKIGKAFKRASYERVRSDVYYFIDIGILEIAVQQKLEVSDITSAVVVDSKRDEFLLKAFRVHDGEPVIDFGMARFKFLELGF